jgi:hypothetical protein
MTCVIEPGNVPGRFAGALRQRANLGSDDREPLAGIAGARRLHRRVQGQEIGLEGDIVD